MTTEAYKAYLNRLKAKLTEMIKKEDDIVILLKMIELKFKVIDKLYQLEKFKVIDKLYQLEIELPTMEETPSLSSGVSFIGMIAE